MPKFSIDLLLELAHFDNEDERESFIFQHPVLLNPDIYKEVSGRISSMPARERKLLKSVLKNLQDLHLELEENPDLYPIGFGPIERILSQQQKGAISSKYAEMLARAPDTVALLSPLYLRALSRYCLKSTYEGRWQDALQLQNLAITCVDSLADSEEKTILSLDWVEIAHVSLCYIPDGRLYRKALVFGEKAMKQARASGNKRLLGKVLHRLGILHLHPYTYERSNKNYDQDILNWQKRLYNELGDEILSIPKEELKMPEPTKALKMAEGYLRQAVDIREGYEKGMSLKALIQTLEWREDVLGENVDRKQIISLCQQALDFIKLDTDPHQRLAVLATLGRYGQSVRLEEVDKILETSMDEYIRRFHAIGAMDLIQNVSSIFSKTAPLNSLEILRKAHSLYKLYGNENQWKYLWSNEIDLIISGLAPEIPSKLPKGGMNAVSKTLYDSARKEQWDIQKLAAGLISLAGLSYKWNEELAGLEILEEAKKIAPIFVDNYANAIAHLQAGLTHGMAVNSVNSGEMEMAVEYYSQALRQFMDLNMLDTTVYCLDLIQDLAFRSGSEVAQKLVLGISPVVLLLERKIGEPATTRIQRLCKHTLASMVNHGANRGVLFFLRQVAKGLSFSTALYSGSRYRWQEDRQGLDILNQIRDLMAEMPPESHSEALLDDASILTAYIRPDERQSGDNPEKRLANLQQNYDAYFNDRLLAGAEWNMSTYLTTSDVQAGLDNRTVLLDYYLGRAPNGNSAIHFIVMTREDVEFFMLEHEMLDNYIAMGDGERQIIASPYALFVEQLRNELMSEKFIGPRVVSYEAGEILERDLFHYFGSLVGYLDELNGSGKDHLCIVPHGPLHYYPFHLIGEPEKPLADKWIVTYLPNLGLLVPRRGLPAVSRYRSQQLTAIGLGFEESELPNLGRMPNSAREAQEVAKIFGLQAIPEAKATKATLSEALRESRYVHISTHGRHNVVAPAFQCIYLTPDDESDGRLYAYELLSMDLRGLEILTLSACETALGRFDAGDNLRGLPASFFLAGVSTTAFYHALKENKGKLDAFAIAQRETRNDFPKYSSWGPFCLMGDWL